MGASQYAGLVSRFVALVVDGLVVTLIVLAVASLPELTWSSLSPLRVPPWLSTTTSDIAMAVPFIYFTVLWAMTGQTVGGLVTGTMVERRDGRKVGLPLALARAVVGLLLAPLWIVGMLFIVADPERRAWHDRLTGTDVRYAPRPKNPVRRSRRPRRG